jgi:hypothetical protein
MDGLAGLLPIGTFILGFLTSRFTMSKKERADVAQLRFQNSRELMERQNETFQDYVSALDGYINALEGDADHFVKVATVGERYFYQLKIASDAILSDAVDANARDNTLVPKIREAVERSLPEHYDALREIAAKKGFRYDGELRRENYSSLYAVVEKYGT